MDRNESFWDRLLLGEDQRQTNAIRRMDEELERMASQALSIENLFRQVRQLYDLDRAQARELAEMRAVLRVMGQQLIELGIDESVLRYRTESAIEELYAVEEEAPGEAPGEAARDLPTTQCARCGRTVAVAQTNITEYGTVCDACA